MLTVETKEGADGALYSALISSSFVVVFVSFCFALVTDPVDVIVVAVSSTKDADFDADNVTFSLRTLTGEMTGSTTSSVFRPSVALLIIILFDFRFGTLLLSPFFLVLALVLLRSRNVPDEEIVEDDERLLRRTGSLARRADGSRGTDDEEDCLFEIPIDGMVARWLRSTGVYFVFVIKCNVIMEA